MQTEIKEKWDTLTSEVTLEKVVGKLIENGIGAQIVETGAQARDLVLSMIPEGEEVFTMTSVTLDTIGLATEINESGKYSSVRQKLNTMNRQTQADEMRKLGAAPNFAIGSAHAVTEDGQVVIASNTGSQLAGYVYGARNVIWVIGAQKIVKNLDSAFKRIYEHTLPLESERAHKAYGVDGSNVSKLLVVNKEVSPGRIKVILVKEKLGF